MLQKEVKVKILKDSIHLLVSRSPPSAGGGGQQLTSELEVVLANYHKLCDRFKSKCHTLEVTCERRQSAALTSRSSPRPLDLLLDEKKKGKQRDTHSLFKHHAWTARFFPSTRSSTC